MRLLEPRRSRHRGSIIFGQPLRHPVFPFSSALLRLRCAQGRRERDQAHSRLTIKLHRNAVERAPRPTRREKPQGRRHKGFPATWYAGYARQTAEDLEEFKSAARHHHLSTSARVTEIAPGPAMSPSNSSNLLAAVSPGSTSAYLRGHRRRECSPRWPAHRIRAKATPPTCYPRTSLPRRI